MISVHGGRTGKRKPPTLYSRDTRKPLFSVQGTPPVFSSLQTLHYSKRIRRENNQITREARTKGQKPKSWEKKLPYERSKGTKCQTVKDSFEKTGRNFTRRLYT